MTLDTKRIGAQWLRNMAAIASVVFLTACGGGDPMTAYGDEKARITGALPKEVSCTELPRGSETILDCRSPDEALMLYLSAVQDGSATTMSMTVKWDKHADDVELAHGAFRKVMDAYGFDETKEGTCLRDGRFVEQKATFKLLCQGGSQVGLMITFSQSRPV